MAQPYSMGKYRPYSIISPPYEITSGGIRVMHGLRSWLETKGQIVYMNATINNGDFVAVYPEIYHGNEAMSRHVVRYILQTPGIMSSYGNPSPSTDEYKTNPIYENDKFYIFSKIYDTFGVDNDHILFLPIINLHLFKDLKRMRNKTCYLVGKGTDQHKHPAESIELTRQFATDQYALAELLNSCHTLFCYDRLSAMIDIARLCGCKVRYYGDFTKEQLGTYETGLNGLTYKDEEERNLKTNLFLENYEFLIRSFSHKLDLFIEATQS